MHNRCTMAAWLHGCGCLAECTYIMYACVHRTYLCMRVEEGRDAPRRGHRRRAEPGHAVHVCTSWSDESAWSACMLSCLEGTLENTRNPQAHSVPRCPRILCDSP